MPARVDQRGLLRSETVRSGVFLISADVGSGGRAFDAFCQEALAADVSSATARAIEHRQAHVVVFWYCLKDEFKDEMPHQDYL